MKNVDSQIWAYLHNELPTEDRRQFEEALANSPELQQELEQRQMTHEELLNLLPLMQEQDDRLTERLLAEWEAEHPEFREKPKHKPVIRLRLPLISAAAAAAVILLLMQPWDPNTIQWQRTVIGSAPQLRGESGTSAQYTPTELKQAARDLQQAAEARIMTRVDSPKHWKLKITVQELALGSLAVEVSGHPRGRPDQPEIWNQTFDSLQDFQEYTPVFASRIAGKIAARNNG